MLRLPSDDEVSKDNEEIITRVTDDGIILSTNGWPAVSRPKIINTHDVIVPNVEKTAEIVAYHEAYGGRSPSRHSSPSGVSIPASDVEGTGNDTA